MTVGIHRNRGVSKKIRGRVLGVRRIKLRGITISVTVSELVGWCFESSQPQRITSGLNTNFALSPSHSFHKSCFFSHGHLHPAK